MKSRTVFITILPLLLIIAAIPISGQDSVVNSTTEPLRLLKPGQSGDQQNDVIHQMLDEPVRVLVVDSLSRPAAGKTVYFRILYQPKKSEGFSILDEEAVTDSSGMAFTRVQLGSQPGTYEIAARIRSSQEPDFQVFTFYARKGNWLLMLVFAVLGGLGLFLLGMEMMSEGMKKSAGDKLRSILGNLTRNRILALGLGTFVTMVIQSSSAVSVMLVGFVNS